MAKWTSTDPGDLPGRPGLVRLDDADGRAVLIGASMDLRRFVRTRLERGLGDIVASCRHQPVGSSFEADCLYLDVARDALPHACRAVADRRRAWMLHLDPDAPTPVWRKRGLHEFDARPAGTLLGPIADKDSAGRFGEALDSVFDLCRFPNVLAQTPDGSACAYREMGRCNAPCDGSEPMDDYRAHVREAIDAASGGIDAFRSLVDRRMHDASGSQAFERATELKSIHRRLGHRAFRHVRRLEDLHHVLLRRSPVDGFVRAFCCDAAGIAFHEDLDDLDTFVERTRAHAPRPCPFDEPTIDLVGMIAFHLFDAKGTSIHVADLDTTGLKKAARTCLGIDDDLTEHEAGT